MTREDSPDSETRAGDDRAAGPERPYDVARYLQIRSAGSADLAVDGTLAFLMDTTGTPQVWTLDEPGGWPQQRTFYDERVAFVDWSPERRELAFGMDEGGNERMQLYRLNPDAGRVHEWTGMPDAKHRWGGWSHDGERFAFASNRRSTAVFDVYVQHRTEAGTDADRVSDSNGLLSVVDWSPDDDRLLVHESHGNFDHDLHVLDVATGERTHITPHEEDTRFHSPQWGPDGEGVYTVTDHDGDLLRLARLDVSDRTLTTVVADETWNVDGVAVDEETGRLVYSRNVDGYTDLTVAALTDAVTVETIAEPELPRGVAGGVSFDGDATAFAATVSGRTINTNTVVVDAETGTAEQWTHAGTAGIPPETFVEPELVHYPTFDGRDIPAFFSTPDDATDGETPVIVDVHGGPEAQRRPAFDGVKQYFLSNGYAVFEPNVRGSSGYGRAYSHLDDVEKRMDSVRDVREAVDWLHDHPVVDPDRIAVMGSSYGGFVVLAAMTEYPDLWAAGVDIVGITNFVTFLENTGEWRREVREVEYGSLTEDREFLESISPINSADQITAPLFVLHGENDPRVPVGEAEQIVEEVREQDVPVRKLLFEDEGHGIVKLDNKIDAYRHVVDFLETHV